MLINGHYCLAQPALLNYMINWELEKNPGSLRIIAYEIGRTQGIYNKGREAGEREIVNILIAEGGWAGFQKLQWKKLTDYLIHQIELKE